MAVLAKAMLVRMQATGTERPTSCELRSSFQTHKAVISLFHPLVGPVLLRPVNRTARFIWPSSNGGGSKLNHQGTAGFCPYVHIPGFHFGMVPVSFYQGSILGTYFCPSAKWPWVKILVTSEHPNPTTKIGSLKRVVNSPTDQNGIPKRSNDHQRQILRGLPEHAVAPNPPRRGGGGLAAGHHGLPAGGRRASAALWTRAVSARGRRAGSRWVVYSLSRCPAWV